MIVKHAILFSMFNGFYFPAFDDFDIKFSVHSVLISAQMEPSERENLYSKCMCMCVKIIYVHVIS